MSEHSKKIIEIEKHLLEFHYFETSSKIASLHNRILNRQISEESEISTSMAEVFRTFSREFGNIITIGRKYRRKCFDEISTIVFQSILTLKEKGLELPSGYSQFYNRMDNQDKVINSMSEQFGKLYAKKNRTREESEIMFSTGCYTYQVALEGIFSELTKVLYALMKVSTSEGEEIPSTNVLSDDNVWAIYRKCEKEFGIKPVFLENWKEKSEIRNAIAHAQATYNPLFDQVHFISKSNNEIIPDKVMSFSDFYAIWMQIADAVDSFRYTMRLMNVMDALAFLLESNRLLT